MIAPAGKAMSSNQVGPSSASDLLPLVYQELKRIARRARIRLAGGETLATTALIHEAYLRLASAPGFETRGHFLRTAAVAMRQILIDRVRAQLSEKRGGGAVTSVDELPDFIVEDEGTVLGVHDALERLGGENPRMVQVVECRFFGGLSEAETAEALGTSERTVQRDWAAARAWLKKEIAAG